MDAWSLMRGDAFIHFVSGSRRVNIRLGVLLLIPKSPQTRPISTSRDDHPAVSPRLDLSQQPKSNIRLRASYDSAIPAIDINHLAEDQIIPPRTLHRRL